MDGGVGKAREERVAVVNAGQKGRDFSIIKKIYITLLFPFKPLNFHLILITSARIIRGLGDSLPLSIVSDIPITALAEYVPARDGFISGTALCP